MIARTPVRKTLLGLLACLSLCLLATVGAATGGAGRESTVSAHPAAGSGQAARPAHFGSQDGNIWAGYVATGAPQLFHQVSASWVLPSVDCFSPNDVTAFWVGFNGYGGSQTVQQTGVAARCDSGSPVYQAWYEMFPDPPVYYDEPVGPGDSLTATVLHDNSYNYTLSLTNNTRGWNQTTNQVAGPDNSAEVIVEAPNHWIAPFGTMTFTGATVNNSPLGSLAPTALYISGSGLFLLASPGNFNSAGDSFSVQSLTDH
ncbi:G1 family glutamic endopeptidase [Embleya sp. AB8]|uniref:G1 family glutamic endopeptidase n=1 Tax=Embleya sp. AB8 TaxID=3156304 RepID=UPI003C774BC9